MSEEVEQEIKDPKAVLDALERAKTDAKKYREEAEGLRAENATLKETVESTKNADSEWKDRAKELYVKNELGSNADRLMKFVDMDSIDFDENGTPTGIEEAISKVKEDLPELFDNKKRVGGAADLFERGDPPKKASGSEAQVARLFNRR